MLSLLRQGRGTASKLDEVILRDLDFNTIWGLAGDGVCEQRTYYAQNWRGDVVNTLDSTGARRETVRYSTYGVPFGMLSGDVNGSGGVGILDRGLINTQIGKTYGVSGYTVLLDVDLDGDGNVDDENDDDKPRAIFGEDNFNSCAPPPNPPTDAGCGARYACTSKHCFNALTENRKHQSAENASQLFNQCIRSAEADREACKRPGVIPPS